MGLKGPTVAAEGARKKPALGRLFFLYTLIGRLNDVGFDVKIQT